MDDIIFPDTYTRKEWIKDKYKKPSLSAIRSNFDLDANRKTLKAELHFSGFTLLPKDILPDPKQKYSSEEMAVYIAQYLRDKSSREYLSKEVSRLNVINVEVHFLDEYPLMENRDFRYTYRNYFIDSGLKAVKKLSGKELEDQMSLRIRGGGTCKVLPFEVAESDSIVVERISKNLSDYRREHLAEVRKKAKEESTRKKELKLLEELKAKYEQ